MRIAIRADSGMQIGGGHVMRCLSLALAAREMGHEVRFVCTDVSGNLGERLKDAGIAVSWLPSESPTDTLTDIESWRPFSEGTDARKTTAALTDFHPDWVILDHYGLGGKWVKAVQANIPHLNVLALDDLDREPLFADIILDVAGIAERPRKHVYPVSLVGPEFALLRAEFRRQRQRSIQWKSKGGNKVVVMPGMSDIAGLSSLALKALTQVPELDATVILGPFAPNLPALKELIDTNSNWSIKVDVSNVAEILAEADFCIGAGGGGVWERCCLGVPSIVVATASNQLATFDILEKTSSAIVLDFTKGQCVSALVQAIEKLKRQRDALSTNAAQLCDGRGAHRVIEHVEDYERSQN